MVKHRLLVGAQVAALACGASLLAGGKAAADVVFPDDVIVQGSLCVGLDCVNNEDFGFDTIRLKENNLRIKFMDTSVAPFPTNDWQLTANDSASGGANKFSIDDITGAKTPFTITAGAATNSIFVDSTGRVGLRTATPVLDLHIATSNTPAHRLEQNNSGGFTAQTWDIAGNEANFFVRDVTSGSRLPLRIRPGAPTSSLDISATGDVGIGTASPETLQGGLNMVGTILQVRNSADHAQLALSAAGAGKVPDIKMENSDATATRRIFETVYEGGNNLAKWRFANETNGSHHPGQCPGAEQYRQCRHRGRAPGRATSHDGQRSLRRRQRLRRGHRQRGGRDFVVPRVVGAVQACRRCAGAAEGADQRHGAAPADRRVPHTRPTCPSTG